MKIIKQGRQFEEIPNTYRGICAICGCMFECCNNEINNDEIDRILEFGKGETPCPNCKYNVDIYPKLSNSNSNSSLS